ncbi:exocyst complex component 7 protein [Dioscorea alata]|uniref:Exocyst complex component 7 protein n=1 Tax=Dioscorea alata TaxID=55571 RepID=A0ACB7W6S3_DIOAL|nr:exocyst complex component 7 protein [Dioscorea alata]
MAKVDGQEKVIATAQHIVKSLATSTNAAEDMIRILSGFDNRLSDLFPSPAAPDGDGPQEEASEAELLLDAADQVVLRWDNSDSLLFDVGASLDDASEYLTAVDDLISLVYDEDCSDDLRSRAETTLQIAMTRLEDEFRHLMIRHTVPLDPQNLSDPGPRRPSLSFSSFSAARPSPSFSSDHGEPSTIDDSESSAEDDHQIPHHNSADPEGEEEEQQQQQGSSELIHPEVVADLKSIADRMILSGYGKELCQVYSSVRREVLDECLSILGVDRMSIDEVQRIEWQTLDDRMRKWVQAVRVAIGLLLPGERRICDQIFAESPTLRDECFAEAAKGCVMQLLNFGDAIAVCRRSSEKLFRILGMYEALSGVMPELRSMFPGEHGELLITEAEEILTRLGDAAKGTFNEFGNDVQNENSKKTMPNGDIHPITRYVMNYLVLLVSYKDSLDFLLDESSPDDGNHPEGIEQRDGSGDFGLMSPTARRLLACISYLEANLEEKSKLYDDGGMQYVFLMNNMLYIVQKVKDSELRALLGDHWVRRRRGQVRQYATSYLRASWTKVLSYLKDDGLGGSGSSNSASRMAIKDRFKNFNMAFEEIYRTQIVWRIADNQLREELRISISEKVIPAYRAFMGRFGGHLEGRHAAKYIKYTPEDLEDHLLDLFEGSPGGPQNHPRRKLGS